jgi:hypothetical protein
MADLNEFLQAKHLGVPTWLLATGGVAIGAGILLYMRQKKAAAAAAPTTTDSSAAGSVAGITQPTGYPQSVNKSVSNYYNNPPTTQPTADTSGVPGFLENIQMSQYVVKGIDTSYKGGTPDSQGRVNDSWPDGIAQIVYELDPNDLVNHASDAVLIELANPTLLPPYPIGTTVNYPTNGPQGWVPAAKTTSLTTTAAGSPTASGS